MVPEKIIIADANIRFLIFSALFHYIYEISTYIYIYTEIYMKYIYTDIYIYIQIYIYVYILNSHSYKLSIWMIFRLFVRQGVLGTHLRLHSWDLVTWNFYPGGLTPGCVLPVLHPKALRSALV
jgi:hypothetical protein